MSGDLLHIEIGNSHQEAECVTVQTAHRNSYLENVGLFHHPQEAESNYRKIPVTNSTISKLIRRHFFLELFNLITW